MNWFIHPYWDVECSNTIIIVNKTFHLVNFSRTNSCSLYIYIVYQFFSSITIYILFYNPISFWVKLLYCWPTRKPENCLNQPTKKEREREREKRAKSVYMNEQVRYWIQASIFLVSSFGSNLDAIGATVALFCHSNQYSHFPFDGSFTSIVTNERRGTKTRDDNRMSWKMFSSLLCSVLCENQNHQNKKSLKLC